MDALVTTEWLANELAAHQFDMKWLLREIALSDAYQRSSQLPEGDPDVKPGSYRVFLERPLSAEQVVASVVQATGAIAAAARRHRPKK